jgi:tripartite-type tricarboxylate transporter receptor subunit TctC
MRTFRVLLAFTTFMLGSCLASAQSWPTKPVRVIVPVPPGQGADIITRLIAERLSPALGQPFVVDNRPGAGTMVGSEIAAKAPPDGYTFLAAGSSALAINPHLYRKMAYDPLRDFAPVTHLVTIEFVLAVHPSLPVSSVPDFIKLAREKQGELTYGSPGNGTTAHIVMAMLASVTDVKLTHVPYKGSPPALADLVAGRIAVLVDSIAVTRAQLSAGKIRALGVTAAKRSPLLPDVPTLDEQGLKGFDMSTWTGLVAPAGTPDAVVNRLSAETVRVLGMAEVRHRINDLGMVPVGNSPEQFGAYIRSEFVKWENAVKVSGATVE